MNKFNQLAGAGIALIAGSVLAVAPVIAEASAAHPTRVCVDNGSASQCESLVQPSLLGGGSGQEVAVRPIPSGRLDTKDHPNYGPVTAPGRPTPPYVYSGGYTVTAPGRPDVKDHPNYGPVTAGRPDVTYHAPTTGP
jgi:hypothetical protein